MIINGKSQILFQINTPKFITIFTCKSFICPGIFTHINENCAMARKHPVRNISAEGNALSMREVWGLVRLIQAYRKAIVSQISTCKHIRMHNMSNLAWGRWSVKKRTLDSQRQKNDEARFFAEALRCLAQNLAPTAAVQAGGGGVMLWGMQQYGHYFIHLLFLPS